MKTSIHHLAILLLLSAFSSCRKAEINNALNSSKADDALSVVTKPNVILILADDVGYETPNYTGGQSYQTPNLNFLAANGMQFTQCHTAPLCSPSRFMLMTAKYNFRNYTTWGTMDTSQRTIANLLKRAGYATCAAGKWQFDGGDASLHAFGFDKYLVTNPFNLDEDDPKISIYKNPQVYENGAYWPADSVQGKYAEDLFVNYMFNFIDANKNKKPFFIYWAPNLVHKPFGPTPDDPEFATWNPLKKQEDKDTVFYTSMVKYMDKDIGKLISKLQANNLQSKTLVLFLGDNGSTPDIHSLFNGQIVTGAKSSSTEGGTHVPMLAYMPGQVLSGATDTSLISLVDFMSTIGDAAKIKIPVSYGITDGISFSAQLKGNYSNSRPWIFCHFLGSGKNEDNPQFLKRWMQDHTYKQYDTLPNIKFSLKFYNIAADPKELHAIPQSQMTQQEKNISNQFLNNMKQLH